MKEIKINDVDVAGCEFFDSNYCKLCDMRAALDELIVHRQYCDRTINNDCYYKQLKRLEKQYNDLINRVCLENYERLEQENAELKAKNERLKELKCKFKEYCTCNTEKYIQCMQEIKEIAEDAPAVDTELSLRILDLITKSEEEE